MGEFSWKKDSKFVNWKDTLWMNGLRAASSGLVLSVLVVIVEVPQHQMPIYMAPIMIVFGPIVIAFAYLLFYMPCGIMCLYLKKLGVPFVGLFTIGLIILIIWGDPLVYVLEKKYHFLPVKNFKILNFEWAIMVIDEEKRKAAMARA